MLRAGPPAAVPVAALGNRADILAADIPAGGKTSARAIARMYAALLGEVDGVRLISPERLREVTAVTAERRRPDLRQSDLVGAGVTPSACRAAAEPVTSAFGMGGAGGSFAYGDTASGLAFAVTKNRLTADFSAATQLIQIVSGH